MKLFTLMCFLLSIMFSTTFANVNFDQCHASAINDNETIFELRCMKNDSIMKIKTESLYSTCSSSIWCSLLEHCVNGECVPKDYFNQCSIFDPCSFGDECIDGVCQ